MHGGRGSGVESGRKAVQTGEAQWNQCLESTAKNLNSVDMRLKAHELSLSLREAHIKSAHSPAKYKRVQQEASLKNGHGYLC